MTQWTSEISLLCVLYISLTAAVPRSISYTALIEFSLAQFYNWSWRCRGARERSMNDECHIHKEWKNTRRPTREHFLLKHLTDLFIKLYIFIGLYGAHKRWSYNMITQHVQEGDIQKGRFHLPWRENDIRWKLANNNFAERESNGGKDHLNHRMACMTLLFIAIARATIFDRGVPLLQWIAGPIFNLSATIAFLWPLVTEMSYQRETCSLATFILASFNLVTQVQELHFAFANTRFRSFSSPSFGLVAAQKEVERLPRWAPRQRERKRKRFWKVARHVGGAEFQSRPRDSETANTSLVTRRSTYIRYWLFRGSFSLLNFWRSVSFEIQAETHPSDAWKCPQNWWKRIQPSSLSFARASVFSLETLAPRTEIIRFRPIHTAQPWNRRAKERDEAIVWLLLLASCHCRQSWRGWTCTETQS